MSVLRSLVASTSSSPSSSSPAARSLVFLRRLATAPPAPDSVIAAFQSRSPLAKWELGVPQLVQAQLPPSILNAVDQPRFVHPPKAPLDTPAKFIGALGRGLTKKLDGKVSLETMPWKHLMQWSHEQWMEKGGLEHKDAKYVMWLVSEFKKGRDPRRLAMEPKKPKKFRQWGPAVQDGIRLKDARFKMDLTHARHPYGLPGFPFRGSKRED